ncbi:hypothetical protein D7D52_28640 [Nocardia yunnanensis]|uniref:Uncharacterized protein n=1 Tax=Nocardia yunnanensis TaxID=2382165 RepID=A0A386ZI11_9NOCA|nr:hypothetical protein D7D52_28640 [Nocardia yunnanensis]
MHGMTTSLSTPGAHAELLARLLGNRAELAELVSGPLAAGLHSFVAERTKKPEGAGLPEEHGCVVRTETFLTFQGICERSDQQVSVDTRDKVDHLTDRGLFIRGLVLGCAHCTHVSFVPIDNLGSKFRCQRCLSDNNLTRERWHKPFAEPQWFYDLHPTARTLLSENGHVPLLLSHYLRQRSRRFADAAEFNLLGDDNRKKAETDLLALADEQLSVR